jgi:two-component system response regulator DevR
VRIFVVDDDDDVRLVVCMWLETATDHLVVGDASNIGEAVRRLPATRPNVIVTDLVMGAGAGAGQLVAQLRDAAPDAHVVVYSGHDPAGGAPPPGVDRYVVKGTSLDALTDALSTLE